MERQDSLPDISVSYSVCMQESQALQTFKEEVRDTYALLPEASVNSFYSDFDISEFQNDSFRETQPNNPLKNLVITKLQDIKQTKSNKKKPLTPV